MLVFLRRRVLTLITLTTGLLVVSGHPQQPSRKFSTARCLGLPWDYRHFPEPFGDLLGNANANHCSLTNVCYNTENAEFVFFRAKEMTNFPLLHDLRGVRLFQYPEDHFESKLIWSSPPPEDIYHMRTAVTIGEVPGNAVWLRDPFHIISASGVELMTNPGHFWYERGVALLMLEKMHLYPNARARFVAHDMGKPEPCPVSFPPLYAPASTRPHRASLLDLIYRHGPLPLGNLTCSQEKHELVCFRKLLIGEAGLAYMGPRGSRVFDDASWRYVKPSGVDIPRAVALSHRLRIPRTPAKPTIAFIHKVGRRVPVNNNEIWDMLETRFGNVARIVKLDNTNVSRTHVEEVAILSSSTLLISPAGGISSLALFLPPGSTMIQLGFWNTILNMTQDYDSPQLYALSRNIEFKILPMRPHNVLPCEERNQHHTVKSQIDQFGDFVYCDFMVELESLYEMVVETLYGWILLNGDQTNLRHLLTSLKPWKSDDS